MLKIVQVTFYTMDHPSSFVVDFSPTVNRRMTYACVGSHLLRFVILSPWFVN
jgi:hypothetical protein